MRMIQFHEVLQTLYNQPLIFCNCHLTPYNIQFLNWFTDKKQVNIYSRAKETDSSLQIYTLNSTLIRKSPTLSIIYIYIYL